MIRLVLLRHGNSEWNRQNRFTGWTDIDLCDSGVSQAEEAARRLKKKGFAFDICYTSLLRRAIRTSWIVLDRLDLMWIPVVKSWRLNERHYGALQGKNKSEVAKKYGDEKVLVWRRSYDVRPPVAKGRQDPRYSELAVVAESLKDVVQRILPFWHQEVEPQLWKKKKVLIAAHGNSLRALVKYLDNLSDKEVMNLNIPTGIPLVYELDSSLTPVRHYYLASKKELDSAVTAVAQQGKAK